MQPRREISDWKVFSRLATSQENGFSRRINTMHFRLWKFGSFKVQLIAGFFQSDLHKKMLLIETSAKININETDDGIRKKASAISGKLRVPAHSECSCTRVCRRRNPWNNFFFGGRLLRSMNEISIPLYPTHSLRHVFPNHFGFSSCFHFLSSSNILPSLQTLRTNNWHHHWCFNI